MSEIGGHAIIQALKAKHQEAFKILQLLLFIKANDKVFWVDDPETLVDVFGSRLPCES